MITIIDYGAGNIKSIQNMLRKIGVDSCITNQVEVIEKADKLILPGVGHFDHGMKQLKASGLVDVLTNKVSTEKKPILGICLGAQLLGNSSEEGMEKGLGWIPMKVVRFDKKRLGDKLKVPHMGWSRISKNNGFGSIKGKSLFEGLNEDARFYFVHTYYMEPESIQNVLTTSTFGHEFVSAVRKDNIYGVQFHPEKSHVFGMQLLKNFAEL